MTAGIRPRLRVRVRPSSPTGTSGRRLRPWRRAISAAAVVALVRPSTWVLALAGFLCGGGLLLAAWPITVLPTPSGLQNLLAVPVSTLVFGSPSQTLVLLVIAAVAAVVAIVLLGLVVGSWAERELVVSVAETAAEEGYADGVDEGARGTGVTRRVAVLRLASLAGPAAVAVAAWQTLYDVTYRELILPGDLATPLPLRVLAQIPVPLAALLAVWLLSDTAAAAGIRRLVLERRGLLASFALGWLDVLRRPLRLLGLGIVGVLAQAVSFAPALVAASIGWGVLRQMLEIGGNPLAEAVMTAIWVAIWLAALCLAAVGASFRSALATLAALPARTEPAVTEPDAGPPR